MPSKLKIKMGHIEFEYEGDAEFDRDAIKDLFTHMESLMGAAPVGAFDNPAPSVQNPADATNKAGNGEFTKLAANSVAAHLGVSSGSDLVIAAAAHLQLCTGKESFTRKDLLETMQSAKTYYKGSMSSNLTKSIDALIAAKRINSLSNSDMSLSAGEQNTLKAKLAK